MPSRDEIELASSKKLLEGRPYLKHYVLGSGQQFKAFLEEPVEDQGTRSSVAFRNDFTHLGSINAFKTKDPKEISLDLELFHHEVKSDYYVQTYFTIYEQMDPGVLYPTSAAKIVVKIFEDKLHIIQINSYSDYRLGSVLVHLAIEFGILHNCKDFLLTSSFSSGHFWYKLGFSPQETDVFKQLLTDEKVDGREMYLPASSLLIWKDRIKEKPLLPLTFKTADVLEPKAHRSLNRFFKDVTLDHEQLTKEESDKEFEKKPNLS